VTSTGNTHAISGPYVPIIVKGTVALAVGADATIRSHPKPRNFVHRRSDPIGHNEPS
jgi:hypothetical protein